MATGNTPRICVTVNICQLVHEDWNNCSLISVLQCMQITLNFHMTSISYVYVCINAYTSNPILTSGESRLFLCLSVWPYKDTVMIIIMHTCM